MSPESWLIVTVAAAFLLVGVAGSPLAWVALHFRRSRMEELTGRRWLELANQVRALEARLEQSDAFSQVRRRNGVPASPHGALSWRPEGPQARFAGSARAERAAATARAAQPEPPLIAVPTLTSAPEHREELVSGLSDRFAAIWSLAENGDSPEEIAQATGQPIGQVDLILGLLRHIAGARMNNSHAAHD
jgi:hypothetical protein